jgi:Pyridoxamine 5'-phosphate oxidase
MSKPPQGDTALLADPAAQSLLASTNVAHLAYSWTDGSPRCTPIWFHWNGEQVVMCGPAGAPRTVALQNGAQVAVTIDSGAWPYAALMIRGSTSLEQVSGMPAEYRAAAVRYFGAEMGNAWTDGLPVDMPATRITVTPEWVGLVDFDDMRRLPSALAG